MDELIAKEAAAKAKQQAENEQEHQDTQDAVSNDDKGIPLNPPINQPNKTSTIKALQDPARCSIFILMKVLEGDPSRPNHKPRPSFKDLSKWFSDNKKLFKDLIDSKIFLIFTKFEQGLATIPYKISAC